MSLRLAVALLLAIALGHQFGIETADTDGILSEVLVLVFFASIFLVPPIAVGWCVWRFWRPKLPSREPLSRRGLPALLIVLTLLAAGALGWWRVHPAHIRYQFTSGGGISGTWREVQFHHLEHGHWIQGPSVAAWPMMVRFPDLNGDGHSDIEVTGSGSLSRRVTFFYLPDNDGKQYWQLHEREGSYEVNYRPAGLINP